MRPTNQEEYKSDQWFNFNEKTSDYRVQCDGELTFHAFERGTMWSISTSLAARHVAPSKGEYQVPEVEAHPESVTTLVPSRLRTVSRVLHALRRCQACVNCCSIVAAYPLIVIQ